MKPMKPMPPQHTRRLAHCLLAGTLVWAGGSVSGTFAAMYWCSDRAEDQQLQFKEAPGCEPLFQEQEEEKARESEAPSPKKIGDLESAVSDFLQRYRQFLACCASDLDSADEIKGLEREANELLKGGDETAAMGNVVTRTVRIRQMIVPLARARDRLRSLKDRLEQLDESQRVLKRLDYERAGHERRNIQDEVKSVQREFRPTRQPGRALTGTGIGVTPNTGSRIGTPGQTGTNIGSAPSAGLDIGITPPSGTEIGETPTSGPGIGSSATSGTAIGDSSFNR